MYANVHLRGGFGSRGGVRLGIDFGRHFGVCRLRFLLVGHASDTAVPEAAAARA